LQLDTIGSCDTYADDYQPGYYNGDVICISNSASQGGRYAVQVNGQETGASNGVLMIAQAGVTRRCGI
jgi:hypothetical protein